MSGVQIGGWGKFCYLTIKSDTGQHSQFLQCFGYQMSGGQIGGWGNASGSESLSWCHSWQAEGVTGSIGKSTGKQKRTYKQKVHWPMYGGAEHSGGGRSSFAHKLISSRGSLRIFPCHSRCGISQVPQPTFWKSGNLTTWQLPWSEVQNTVNSGDIPLMHTFHIAHCKHIIAHIASTLHPLHTLHTLQAYCSHIAQWQISHCMQCIQIAHSGEKVDIPLPCC